VIQRPTAADTFSDVLEALGLERVRGLRETANKLDLVGTARSDRYSQVRRGGYFIVTHSNTVTKKATLERIAKRLGEPLTVEVVGG
jgi:hypothetical protein